MATYTYAQAAKNEDLLEVGDEFSASADWWMDEDKGKPHTVAHVRPLITKRGDTLTLRGLCLTPVQAGGGTLAAMLESLRAQSSIFRQWDAPDTTE